MPDLDPDYEQEGPRSGIYSFNFNHRSDDSLSNDKMPNMRQIIEGGPSVAEQATAEAAHSVTVASGISPVTPAPITWPMWPVEEDPTVKKHLNTLKMQGREVNPHKWWHTCTLPSLCLQWVMAEMPDDRESQSKEEHGVYHHIEKAQEAFANMKKGKGQEPPFVFDNAALEDIQKTLALWQCNSNRVPPAIHKDPNTHKLICDIDITLWVKAMAPSDKKEFQKFRDLIFEVFLPVNGTSSFAMHRPAWVHWPVTPQGLVTTRIHSGPFCLHSRQNNRASHGL
jgi:hypothetical protein